MDDRRSRRPPFSGSRGHCNLTAAKRTDRVDLDLRWEGGDAAGTTIVDRAWIQSLADVPERARSGRLPDLTNQRKELEVRLPDGGRRRQATVSGRMGSRVERRLADEDRLAIPLPGEGDHRRVRGRVAVPFSRAAASARGDVAWNFRKLGPDVWVRRMYWQLVLPANEHLIADPERTSRASHAGAGKGIFWGRQPLLDQTQLESWSGAAQRTASARTRELSTCSARLGNVEQAELHTASRTWIVLWASGIALVAGLLLIYVPASRHPAALLVVGIALLAAGLIAPEPTLLLAQGASLGLVLTLLAGLLERSVSGRRRLPLIRKEPPSSLVDSRLSTPHGLSLCRWAAVRRPPTTAPVILPEPPGKVER